MKHYGFKFDQPSPEHYVFGSSSLPTTILQEDMDWILSLPKKEMQSREGLETYACTVFTILNCIEILIKKQYGEERNYSERFLAILIKTGENKGSSPQEACEFLRKIGVIAEDLLPFDKTIDTTDKYFSTISPELFQLAQDFNMDWDFKHEFVEPNYDSICKALQCSPLLISVSAWFQRDGKYYRPEGMIDNHATTLFSIRQNDFFRVFDSYEPHIKDNEWTTVPMVVKRFWIKRKEKEIVPPKKSFWNLIIKAFQWFFREKLVYRKFKIYQIQDEK